MKKLAVLISNKGTGTNLQAVIDGCNLGKINAKIIAVVSDTSQAPGLERARRHKLQIKIVPKKEELLAILKKLNPDYICLAGWKQIILDEVIDAFPNRILNTHPGLIPDTKDGVVKNPDGTKGLWNKGFLTDKAIQQFLDKKATYAGCTNHFLSEEFDFGPVIGRCFEKIRRDDSVDSLYKRLKVKENKLYADILERLCKDKGKTVMVIDGGGRGAALVDKYAQSEHVDRILVVPGNDLMQINTKKKVLTCPHLKTTSISEILDICKKEKVDLVDAAQDNAVEAGVVDAVAKIGVPVVGPTKAAGQIEWDKAWARNFMVKYKIQTPKFHTFSSEKEGIEFVKKVEAKGRNPKRGRAESNGWFVKASGLAEGKGAIPAGSVDEAISAIKQMQKFGFAGQTFLLEEWLVGEEFSAFAFCDGKNFQIVGYAQDHKRMNDGDLGENTGGMGCVSNPLIINSNVKSQILKIFEKAVSGLMKEGRQYKGVLYLGGIVVKDKVWVIEFNARWGDPEAQVILPSIQNDLYEISQAIITGSIGKLKINIDNKVRVGVVGASKGYPLDCSEVKGKRISGLEKVKGVKIYGAGVKKEGEKYIANGGRLFCIVGEGKNIIEARKKAYKAMSLISIEGDNLHFRTDIGWRDLARLRGTLRRVKRDTK